MTTYTVNATIQVDVTNPAALDAIAHVSGGSGDERSKIQSAIDAGLKELPGIGRRYGFDVKSASATVE
jgi:hypothetical protein